MSKKKSYVLNRDIWSSAKEFQFYWGEYAKTDCKILRRDFHELTTKKWGSLAGYGNKITKEKKLKISDMIKTELLCDTNKNTENLFTAKKKIKPSPKWSRQKKNIKKKKHYAGIKVLAKKDVKTHADYLKSFHWQQRRLAFAQTPYFADGCAVCGNKEGLNVHHRHYNSKWNEADEDLMPLCRNCHQKMHGIKKPGDRANCNHEWIQEQERKMLKYPWQQMMYLRKLNAVTKNSTPLAKNYKIDIMKSLETADYSRGLMFETVEELQARIIKNKYQNK